MPPDTERITLMEHTHHLRQAGDAAAAEKGLTLALQTPAYRAEALICKGLDALQQNDLHAAYAALAAAAATFPNRTDIPALLGRIAIAQGKPQLADRLLTAAWRRAPVDTTLRQLLWQARSKTLPPATLRSLLLQQLSWADSAQELRQIIRLVTALPGSPAVVGTVRFDSQQRLLHGWAINLRSPGQTVEIELEANGRRVRFPADAPHPLLQQAGLTASHGGIRVEIPQPAEGIHVRFTDGTPLAGSPIAALATFAPPLVKDEKAEEHPVDVLVPVFLGRESTLECLRSLLQHRSANRTAHHIVVLDDASPDGALADELRALAAAGQIDYHRRSANLGFIRSMNRGMALHPERDVVWLNADTRVHGDWLDRLRTSAYSANDIASATPFSNNGELMSFPASRVSHDMPDAARHARLDALAAKLDSAPIDIETGCGFCLYVKRAALTRVGYLDEVELVRGYGEETDWCLRARNDGWRHVGVTNLFVAHEGGLSFGDEKALRVYQNNTLLKQRYPDAEARFELFCKRDPLQPARAALQRARLPDLVTWIADSSPQQWPVPSTRQLQIKGPRESDSNAAPLTLQFRNAGQTARATLSAALPDLPLRLDYTLPRDAEQLIVDLKQLPLDEIIYRQLHALPTELRTLPAALQIPYRIASQDDALLTSDCGNWTTFAHNATAIHLPWHSLQQRYAAAHPQANLVIDKPNSPVSTGRSPSPQQHSHRSSPSPLRGESRGEGQSTPKSTPRQYPHRSSPSPLRGEGWGEGRTHLLIADLPMNTTTAHHWLTLGRAITRQALPITLLLIGQTPWAAQLTATGAVLSIPNLDGPTRAESLTLAGCQAALSLNQDPGADWLAPQHAERLNLPLYAPASPVTQEADASALEQLLPPALLSQLFHHAAAPASTTA